jgi:DNA helicase HerA-like ATPase
MSDHKPTVPGKILVGATAADEGRAYRYLTLSLGNRHGLIAGATGGGKTVSLQLLAEGFANAGTSVFMADIKGDLAGLSQPGDAKPAFVNRAKDIGVAYTPDNFPVVFWDIFGEQGHTVRATVSQMGPLLLARLLDLNDTQEGVLNIIFKVADDQGLLMLDLKDLRAVINHVQENASEIRKTYGSVATASVGAIQRQLLVLESQGAENFFGEPALEISDFIRTDRDGRGTINILAADRLMRAPRLYGTFLLWMLSELFEALPEVGDLDKPKLVFFFDEAHLLFDDAPKALLGAIEQVVRLIRSKGVGVYFVTQNPLDVPDTVLGQLGNRVQHALRAFTPRDQKAVRAAASTFRQNPAFDTEDAILHLGVGEALVSMLGDKGAPEVVDRVLIAPPSARVGPITQAERAAVMAKSPFTGKYDGMIDRESAFEVLRDRAGGGKGGAGAEEASAGGLIGVLGGILGGLFGKTNKKRLSPAEIALRSAVQSAARSAGTQIARQILRGVLGGMSR